MRPDIQALRGLAILLVLLYHARLVAPLKAGYLGVDIFFVVSGYLITGLIQRGIVAGTFSFSDFYFRRAKRLLPAAYVTFLVTVLLSATFLTRDEMRDFVGQLLGAVTFTANFVLWSQTGYFEGAAHLKPLLHVWSLSIEEQYYLLIPAALAFTPRRLWGPAAWVLGAASLLMCLILGPAMPGATFYLLPTRMWELAIGSVAILTLEGTRAGAFLARGFWLAVGALILVPFFPPGAIHPGWSALTVCFATLIVILRRHDCFARLLPLRGLVWLGDISYSLYLIHWPLLAFASNAWVSPVPGLVRLAIFILSIVLAWATFRWVEQPTRRAKALHRSKYVIAALGTSVLVVAIGLAINQLKYSNSPVDYAYIRRANHGLDASCEFGDTFEPKPKCRTSVAPRILIWGDSYAMHLVDGLAATGAIGIVQATKSTCGPFFGMAMFRDGDSYNREWARGCVRFNQSVLHYVRRTPSVEVVVLSSVYGQYLAGSRLLIAADSRGTEAAAEYAELAGGSDIALHGLDATIQALRRLGKRVVLVAPPPSSGFDIGRCLERTAMGNAVLGADYASCEVSEARYRLARVGVLRFLHQVETSANVAVIRLDDYLCRAGRCAVQTDGNFLYRDEGHLTHVGSTMLGRKMDLAGMVMRDAR